MEGKKSSSSIADNKKSIDVLPDELLISIVSLLSVKERARTSVLARRWRCIWKSSRILNFDDSEICNDTRLSLLEKRVTKRRLAMCRFVRSVNRVVRLHSGETIDELRIASGLDLKNADDIDRWIEFAFRKKVQKLELNFEADTDDGRWNAFRFQVHHYLAYTFPDVERFDIPTPPRRGLSLVSLSLNQVDLTREIVESLMSNCPNLEDLRIERANGLTNFGCTAAAPRLRRLALNDCKDLTKIEICAPNLISYDLLSAFCSFTRTKLNGVSSLIHLSLAAFTGDELVFGLLDDVCGCLSRLETLKLHAVDRYFEYASEPYRDLEFPSFPRLRELVLEIDSNMEDNILCFTPLINAAPLLREIVLTLLKSGECSSRQPKRPVMEMVLYVLENAALLEKVVIDKVAHTGEEHLQFLRRNLLATLL